MAANSTSTEDAVSVVVNSTEGDPIEDEPTEGDLSVGEPNEGEPALEESSVDEAQPESDVDEPESDVDESESDDSDQDEIEEAELASPYDEVSDLDEPYTMAEYFDILFKGDPYKNTRNDYVEEEVSVETYEDKLKKIVDYTDKCNSDQNFIIQMHTKSIYDLEPLPEETTAMHLGRFTDKLMLHVWVLKTLDPQDVDRWSGLFINLISNKLDPMTRNLWNAFVFNYKISKHGNNVTMSMMMEFLQATCREYEIQTPSRSIDYMTYIYNDLSHDTPRSTSC